MYICILTHIRTQAHNTQFYIDNKKPLHRPDIFMDN